MSRLREVIEEVSRRVARYQKSGRIGEQDTKATLIEPVLRALGWDVEDVEEVHREYKPRRRDKPVDYALLDARTPRLFIEAKAFGKDLNDRRWMNQIMGYAAVAGVRWVVLTNGDEYRIYNSHATVPIDEKLFRKFRVSAAAPEATEFLELLSKGRLAENRIDVLWRAHFVDAQVKAAIEELFSGEGDLLLVNYLRKRTRDLTTEEIRASLTRCQVALDFPLMPPFDAGVGPATKRSDRAKRRKKRRKAAPGVSLTSLISAGLLRPPVDLVRTYKGRKLEAQILPDGTVSCSGEVFPSPSQAGGVARASVIGRKGDRLPPTNGWTFWHIQDQAGRWVALDMLRQQFAQRQRRGASA